MSPSSVSSGAMFHTFQSLAPPESTDQKHAPKSMSSAASKRITTPHACAECKRRKIRCDGKSPCGQCMGCRTPKPCYYDKHRQRVIPSRKTLDALQQSLDECRSILKRLYPTREPQSLLALSRQNLISLIDAPGSNVSVAQTSPSDSHGSGPSQEYRSPALTTSPDDGSLANLEQIPLRDTEWDEDRRNRDPIPQESDDVNALSLSVDRQSSYLGASSIKAAFIVMLKVAPALKPYLETPAMANRANEKNNERSTYPTPRPSHASRAPSAITWSSEGQTLIDAYFNRVQIFAPMLDEPSFRASYLKSSRNDAPWLALLNMVFAMGSIVALKSDDHNHLNYYNRAKDFCSIDCFGSGHLETLQALALMGGYYLHYINRPNMANAITGAALRMACALGLHRESLLEPNPSESSRAEADVRRRTWWSLFCLDTWASTTMGRPSLGRWGQAITIRPPETKNDANANSTIGLHIRIVPLIENIKFCKIATSIQDCLAMSPLPRNEDRMTLDAKLVDWAENLPHILQSSEPCPEALHTARGVMKWRYQNLRMVLSRPVLLHLAYRGPQITPTADELAAVETCRQLAKQTIEDITREWQRNQMSGWNGAWFLYQASMIPLVSIFWETWNTEKVREWQHQIELVLEGLAAMADWSLAAKRSREVVAKMYEASRGPITRQGSPRAGPHGDDGHVVGPGGGALIVDGPAPHGSTQQQQAVDLNGQPHTSTLIEHNSMLFLDHLDHQGVWDLDGMRWDTIPPDLDMPFDGIPENFEYADPNANWDGTYGMHKYE